VSELVQLIKGELTKSSQNTIYASLKSLKLRGLIRDCGDTERYTKVVGLTNDGTIEAREILIKDGNGIYFSITRQHLYQLLKKLNVEGMFKETAIIVKDNLLTSVQREPLGNLIRFIEVKPSYFNELSGDGILILPLTDLISLVRRLPNDELVGFEIFGNHLKIFTSRYPEINILCKNPDDFLGQFLFSIPEDMSLFNQTKNLSDVHFKAEPTIIKDILEHARIFEEEYVTFGLFDGRFSIRVGGFHNMEFTPTVDLIKGDELCVTFNNINNGFKKLKNVFDSDIIIKTATGAPTIFSEKTEDFDFGILIPPYVPQGQT
jgi:DNA-binding PadR family transcriptional regulator